MSAARRTLTDVLLTVAAVFGVLCALFAVVGTLAGFGVVLFRTGSMSPTIPAGSAALVRTVPAADLRVGQVVTVDRAGQLPVTHRIVSVAPVADDPDVRELVLRGDANTADDPLPYRVETVRRVIGSVPGVAPLLVRWRQPAVLAAVAVLAGLGVTAAFWPRRRRAADPTERVAVTPPDDDIAPSPSLTPGLDPAGDLVTRGAVPEEES